jgi:predicted dehydrogenase
MSTTKLAALPKSAQPNARRSPGSGPFTYATIGVSSYAGVLLDCLEPLIESGEASLVAATVRTRAKAVERCEQIEKRGGRIFQDWKAMVDSVGESLDCLIVPTGIQDHCAMAVYALKRDINVLLEKPIAATVGEAHAILEAAERSKAGLILGYQDIYAESTQAIKQLILDKMIGDVLSASVVCLWPRKDSYFVRNSWAGRLRIGDDWVLDSPINNAMGHFINLPLFWLGDSLLTSANVAELSGSLYRSRELESFDTAAIRMRTSEGQSIDFHGSHACDAFHGPEMRIVGTKGSIHWVLDSHYTVETAAGTQTIPMVPTADIRRLLMRKTMDWLRGENIVASTVEQALQQTRAVHLLHCGLRIHTVSAESIVVDEDKRVLKGLDSGFRRCFSSGQLLTLGDTPWAVKEESIAWTDVAHLSEPTLTKDPAESL